MRRLWKYMLAVSLLASMSACAAAQQPNMDDDFSVLSLEEGQSGKRGRHGRHGHHGQGMMIQFFMKDLNLTEAQKSEFQTLRQSAHAKMKAWKPNMQAAQTKMKAAFLAAEFDRSALEAELSRIERPDKTQMAHNMAEHLLKAWTILTPEQRAKAEARMNQFEARMAKFKANDASDKGQHVQKRLDKMAQKLGLSDSQKAELRSAWEAKKPDRQAHIKAMKAVKSQVLDELKSGQASVDSLAALLEPVMGRGEEHMMRHLDRMETLHAVLNPEQRQQAVTMFEQRAQGFKHRRHRE